MNTAKKHEKDRGKTTIALPRRIVERLSERKVHPNQAYYEVIEEMLDNTLPSK